MPTPKTPPSLPLTRLRSWWLLSSAIRAGADEELDALLAFGADPNARENSAKASQTPLHLACSVGSVRAVQALLAAGASPDASSRVPEPSMWLPPNAMQSPAMAVADSLYAQSRSKVDPEQAAAKMTALVDAGARFDAPVQKGRTVWSDLMLWEGAPVKILLPWLQAGAPVDALDSDGRTLLFKAVCYRRLEDAFLLLDLGADPFFPCCANPITPAKAASSYADSSLAALAARFDAIAASRELEASTPAAARRGAPGL